MFFPGDGARRLELERRHQTWGDACDDAGRVEGKRGASGREVQLEVGADLGAQCIWCGACVWGGRGRLKGRHTTQWGVHTTQWGVHTTQYPAQHHTVQYGTAHTEGTTECKPRRRARPPFNADVTRTSSFQCGCDAHALPSMRM
eukprot:364665-Chlamydomonas_euryale.AAC.2